jgi:hypothetical protein
MIGPEREAKESPVLEATSREQPMKTQHDGKKLRGYCDYLLSVEISVSTCNHLLF